MVAVSLTPSPLRWHDSIIVRVIGLCAVLVMCLFGFVYGISRFYFTEVIREVEEQTQQIVQSVTVKIQEDPNIDIEKLKKEMGKLYQGTPLDFSPLSSDNDPPRVSAEPSEQGHVMVARHPIPFGNGRMLLTVWVTPRPTKDIVRLFKNKFLVLLTGVFLVTLGLMLYLIQKTLRPLRDLSQTCAKISEGNLVPVEIRKNVGEVLALEQTFNRMVASLREKEVMEAKLRQAQRLSAIGNLAAGVAHDVRNPLNSIKLLSSHALGSLPDDEASTTAANQLRTIRKEVDRLEDIVSVFLSLAKERELRLEPSRVDPIITECVRLIRKDAEARGVQIVAELRAGDRAMLLDPKQLTRAILNVLINAMEACSTGGRVRVFTRLTDTACQIEVRDDGRGLSKDVAERAFDPYFTTKPTGTGLGLSITRGILEEHGGAIALTGEEGKGCQVLITLPLGGTLS